nr:hypothetical protein [Klebsiella pneumoniae]
MVKDQYCITFTRRGTGKSGANEHALFPPPFQAACGDEPATVSEMAAPQ